MRINELYELWQYGVAVFALCGVAVMTLYALWHSPFGQQCREALASGWEHYRRLGAFGQLVVAVFFAGVAHYGATKGFWEQVRHGGGDDQLTVYGIYTATSNDVVEVEGQPVTNQLPLVRVEFFGNGGTAETPVSIRASETNEWQEVAKLEPIKLYQDGVTNILEFVAETNYSHFAWWWFGTDLPAIVVTEEGIEIREFVVTTKQVRFAWVCGEREAEWFYIQRKEQGSRGDWVTVKSVEAVYGAVNKAVIDCFTVDKTYDWRIITEIAEGE